MTGVADGDLAPHAGTDPDELTRRREAVAPGPWTWLRQVHGSTVVRVDEPGGGAGVEADAAVTDRPGAVLAVHTADCAGVLLWGPTASGRPVVGAAHAGWRGLEAGVLEATVAALRDLGATGVTWRLGPCISPSAYEFGDADLDRLVARHGTALRAATPAGRPALDLRAGVAAALSAAGARPDHDPGDVPCTAGDPGWYSWRARGDRGRQAAVVWWEPAGEAS
jgi:YfiH family protein